MKPGMFFHLLIIVFVSIVFPVSCGNGDGDGQDASQEDISTMDHDDVDVETEPGQDIVEIVEEDAVEDGHDLPEDAEADEGGLQELDISVCEPAGGPFSLTIDNEYLPMPVGLSQVLEGMEGSTAVRLEITVLDQTEVVAGVTTRVYEEREFEDGEIIEISRNFFVQAPDGTVCYYGEDVDIYEGGVVVSHEGQWRAGEDGNLPGIMMPAHPAVGMTYAQEVAPGVAEDHGDIVAMGETITVPAGEFSDTVHVVDWSTLEAGTSDKVYVSGIGLAVDDAFELVSY